MKRNFFLALLFITFSTTMCFAGVIQVGGGSISDTFPNTASTPPTPRKTGLSTPLPTNKWFNSVILPYASSEYTLEDSLKMYTYPQVLKCDSGVGVIDGVWGKYYSRGLLISYPKVQYNGSDNVSYGYDSTAYIYCNNLKISGYTSKENDKFIKFKTKLKSFSDFSATILWEDETNSSNNMTATIGQGFVFSFFNFSDSVFPAIEFPYNWDYYYGNVHLYKPDTTSQTGWTEISINELNLGTSDRFIIETRFDSGTANERSVFYGIFLPENTLLSQLETRLFRIFITFSSPTERYMSVGLLPSTNLTNAITDMQTYYNFAYNFVTNTEIEWNVSDNYSITTTEFNITTEKIRSNINQGTGTLFCLFPHQYNNLNVSPNYIGKTFDTLRGQLQLVSGNNFKTETYFKGIVPFFRNNLSSDVKSKIANSLEKDKLLPIDPQEENDQNTYFYGKNLAKIANLIPIADNLEDTNTKNYIINKKLKPELKNWFTYTSGEKRKYFVYDNPDTTNGSWGGIIGIGNPNVFINNKSFGTEIYNDHCFHYGYFIYASAILAMYDNDFKTKYGAMVELLIKDIANKSKGNSSDNIKFPYFRNFDFYESHSWANGMGGHDDRGIDLESSSEAMNAWAAIYMWGLATQQPEYIKLGIYLYTNETEAIKNYFFNINNIYDKKYSHSSIGILFSGLASYNELWWKDSVAYGGRQFEGIQLLPMTSSMLYLGSFENAYAEKFYNNSFLNAGQSRYAWNDIWSRFRAMYNPSEAWDTFEQHHGSSGAEIDDGGTATYTYHFIDFFRQNGVIQTGYSASLPSYLVTKKDNKIVYSAYNYTDTSQDIIFYNSAGEKLGYMTVAAKSFKSTSNLKSDKEKDRISVYPVPYKPNSSGRYGGEGIYFEGISKGTNIKIFNVAGEKVFEKNIEDSGDFLWKAKNNAGNNIASGIYFYYIKTSDGKKVKGKLAIER